MTVPKDLLKHEMPPVCPKCKCTEAKVTYCGERPGMATAVEYLRIKCARCGFEYDMKTADAK
jgi:hypothetical protein